jgi:acyl carrier protein
MMSVQKEDVQSMIEIQLGLHDIKGDARLIEDLGAESADVVNIIAAVETKYHIKIEEEEIPEIRTIEDLYQLILEKSPA